MWSRATEGPPHSLRRRLLALVLAAVALASLMQAASAYRFALRHADTLFDAQLQAIAREVEQGAAPGGGLPARGYSVQIWGDNGVLLFQLGPPQPPTPAVIGFSDAEVDGVRYRLYTLRGPGRTVQIAQDLDARRQEARTLAQQAVWPVALLGLGLMLAVWLVIERSMAPVVRLRRQVAARPAEDLSPLPQAGLPVEVQPLVRELNALFARVRQAFDAQQRFVADAAHELRSPLAALRLQAQALRRESPGPQRDEALGRLEEGISRAVNLVNQLLALARQEAHPSPAHESVALQDLCREVVAQLLPQARARPVDLGLATPQAQAAVQGDREALRTLLRNLVDNAIKYTPAGGQVDLRIEEHAGAPVLVVEDSGPGIPESERGRVFERFHRGTHEDIPGSGLGLAIVQAIAHAQGAQVTLGPSAALGGLRVEVRFGAGPGRAA